MAEHLVLERWGAVGSSILCAARGWPPAWLPRGGDFCGWSGRGEAEDHENSQGFSWASSFLKKNFLFIYLLLAALGLHCCVQRFSSCGDRGLLSSCGLWASCGGGCSC